MAWRKKGPKPAAPAGWKVGDVVHLKSGSPRWTVVSLLEDGFVRCAWSDWDTRQVGERDVPAEALRAAYTKPEGEGA